MAKVDHFLFVDESGDPGKPFQTDDAGNKSPTGASLYYILSTVCLTPPKLYQLEHRLMEVKSAFGYLKEIKANDVSLPLYKALLGILNELDITTYYRLVDKTTYKGVFAVDGNRKLHNVFDEYNLAKVVVTAIKECALTNVEVVIDRADRRLLDGKFDNFNHYLKSKVNTKTFIRIEHITHVSSEYVNAMQMSDLISGAVRDEFTGRNTDLVEVVRKDLLVRVK